MATGCVYWIVCVSRNHRSTPHVPLPLPLLLLTPIWVQRSQLPSVATKTPSPFARTSLKKKTCAVHGCVSWIEMIQETIQETMHGYLDSTERFRLSCRRQVYRRMSWRTCRGVEDTGWCSSTTTFCRCVYWHLYALAFVYINICMHWHLYALP